MNPGDEVTYLVDRNINFTNICTTQCRFCAFHKAPEAKGGYLLTTDQILEKIPPLIKQGGTRILLQGGHNPNLNLKWYLDLFKEIKTAFPKLHLNCLSPAEIDAISKREQLSWESILCQMKEVGLDGLPGGGAEILDDEFRATICPDKVKGENWCRIMSIAHKLKLTTTATMVIGFGESLKHRFTHLDMIRELQRNSLQSYQHGFTSFILWTFQRKNTKMYELQEPEVNATEYLKNLAAARIALQNIPHIQASWPTMGPQIAQLALEYGADDFGSTMLEENVVRCAGKENDHCLTVSQIRNFIVESGYAPIQRTDDYSRV
jgi:cyclic dehypoxanthinyl futalosine synthase